MNLKNDLNNIQDNNEKEAQLWQMFRDIHTNIINNLNTDDIYEFPKASLGQDCIILQYGTTYFESTRRFYFTMEYLNKLEQKSGLKVYEIKPIQNKDSDHIMLILGE
jgi:hypothetical protein